MKNVEKSVSFLETQFGKIRVECTDTILISLRFTTQDMGTSDFEKTMKKGIRKKTMEQLASYFSGELKRFDIKVAFQGTEFQKSVWLALRRIPYGQTRSYSDVAQSIGKPEAVRAVASAVAKNPIAIIVPCHRVIRSNGEIGEYAWGSSLKKKLLDLEGQAR